MTDDYHYPHSRMSLPVIRPSAKPSPAEIPPVPQPAPALSASPPKSEPLNTIERKLLEGRVIEAIRNIYDPEIPVNLYDLGLIYNIDVNDSADVKIQMTLTAPACPVAGILPGQVQQRVEAIPEVRQATVELVWDPPWSRDRMTEAALLELGLL